jgi:gliding motility-associated-like protein
MTAFAPTAFTPDQDGHNEAWKIVCNDAVKNFELKIFDRWGNIVFETKDKQEFWFGNSRGGTHFAPDGIYFYRAVIRNVNYEVRTLEGSVVLIR